MTTLRQCFFFFVGAERRMVLVRWGYIFIIIIILLIGGCMGSTSIFYIITYHGRGIISHTGILFGGHGEAG